MQITILLLIILQIISFWWIRRLTRICWLLNKNKFELKPGEKLATCTLRFGKEIQITKADGEPMDEITVLTYSNLGIKNEYIGKN